jgi:Ca2+ transporting ATPase
MLKTICIQGLTQVFCLSIILFKGTTLFDIPSSVNMETYSKEAAIHYSMFFNTFVMFQIFNQFNMRQMAANRTNVFEGLLKRPLFLCFIVSSFILQFGVMRYGGKALHVTELSFKKNLYCLIIGSTSLYSNYVAKTLLP